MLMTAEVTEDRWAEVTRTHHLTCNYFITPSSIPSVPEAVVMTIMRWKGHSSGTPLDVGVVCLKPVDSKNQRVTWCVNNVKLELFNVVSNFDFNRWCFFGYGSINQWTPIDCFEHEREDVIADWYLLSKNHRVVDAISVGAWIHHCLLKELPSSKPNLNS